MSTPNIDFISVNFSQKVADPVATGSTDGKLLTSVARQSYINRAMFKLFETYWTQANGDSKRFIEMFPELVHADYFNCTNDIISMTQSGGYDFFKIIGCNNTTTGKDIIIKSTTEYAMISAGTIPQLTGSSTNILVFQLNQQLIFFSGKTLTQVAVTYIKMPVSPVDGSFLVEGGSFDSPFFPVWNERLADIALDIFKADAQQI